MPFKDLEEKRIAAREAMARLRARRKAEAEVTNRKFEETIPDTPENLNYGMQPTREKPQTKEEFLAENPEATDKTWIDYKIKWSYTHKWKAEKEILDRRKALNERERYQTLNHECVLWRRFHEQGKNNVFQLNHNGINICESCSAWYAKQKDRSALDLNNMKGKQHFEELDGYAQMFAESKPFPEDYIYHSSGAKFPMTKICNICGSCLNEKGKCPVCDPD